MKLDEMIPSKYLKQSDVEHEPTVTVEKITKENVAREDEEADYKYTVKFREFPKSLVLNSTNIKRMGRFLGDDSDDWIDGQVILYVDPDIEFGGKITGGIRVRGITPTNGNKGKPKPDVHGNWDKRTDVDDVNRKLRNAVDDDIPF